MNDHRPSPVGLVRAILPRFGLADPEYIRAWPFLPQDMQALTRLVASFRCDGRDLLLKARTVEHRGTKALFETQSIQKELLGHGVPVARLHTSPDGTTLVLGPDPRDADGEYHHVCKYILGPG